MLLMLQLRWCYLCCWCPDAANVLMLPMMLMHWCCWCTVAADALMLLTQQECKTFTAPEGKDAQETFCSQERLTFKQSQVKLFSYLFIGETASRVGFYLLFNLVKQMILQCSGGQVPKYWVLQLASFWFKCRSAMDFFCSSILHFLVHLAQKNPKHPPFPLRLRVWA